MEVLFLTIHTVFPTIRTVFDKTYIKYGIFKIRLDFMEGVDVT